MIYNFIKQYKSKTSNCNFELKTCLFFIMCHNKYVLFVHNLVIFVNLMNSVWESSHFQQTGKMWRVVNAWGFCRSASYDTFYSQHRLKLELDWRCIGACVRVPNVFGSTDKICNLSILLCRKQWVMENLWKHHIFEVSCS